jgi:ADP-ribose pyrophosphatase YjhB (NUDIX family)
MNYTLNFEGYKIGVFQGDFRYLPIEQVSQVYAIIFNSSDQVLIVHNGDNDQWTLVGGTKENDESLVDCLTREVYEESATNLDLSTLKPGFYQAVYKINQVSRDPVFESYQVRYLVRSTSQDKFLGDPGGSVDRFLWVELENIGDYLDWGKTNELIISLGRDYIAVM